MDVDPVARRADRRAWQGRDADGEEKIIGGAAVLLLPT